LGWKCSWLIFSWWSWGYFWGWLFLLWLNVRFWVIFIFVRDLQSFFILVCYSLLQMLLSFFSKETLKGYKFSFFLFFVGPFLGLFLMFILWGVYGRFFGVFGRFYSFLYIFSFLRLGVYFLLFCGWGSNRKYSLLGGYRSVSQTVSYEVSMIFFILFFVYIMSSYDLSLFFLYQVGFWFLFLRFLFFLGWVFIILSERNRTPFDFSEGESELVSGFNVEYGGGTFSLIFICEYGMIIFLSFISVLLFIGRGSFFVKLMTFCFCFVWVRCCFPRYRYDFLISRAWKILLPFSLFFFIGESRVIFLVF